MNDEEERRARTLAAWEDLVEAKVPSRLGMVRRGSTQVYEIDLSSGDLGVINRVCEAHGLKATAGPFGVTLETETRKPEEVLHRGS